MRQCCAPVQNTGMIRHRADGDPSGRCQRPAKVQLPGAFGYRWFCSQHAVIWRQHNRLVRKITGERYTEDRMATWKHFLLRNIHQAVIDALLVESQKTGLGLSDLIRARLCDHYELDCPTTRSVSKVEHGARTQQLRLQPALYEAIIKDAYEQERSRRSVILEILEAHYLEVSAS